MNMLGVFSAFRPAGHDGPVGGGEISNRELLMSLARRGHDVTVYAFNAGASVGPGYGRVRVIDGGLGHAGPAIGKVVKALHRRRWLSAEVYRHPPDLILTSVGTFGVALKLSKRLNKPLAVLVRARRDMPSSDGSFAKRVARRLVYGGANWTEAPSLIANSRFLLDLCRNDGYAGLGWVVYPPVNVDVAQTEWPAEVKRIAMVGSSAQKGIDIFLSLAARMPATRFTVIGDRSVGAGVSTSLGNVTRMGWTNDPIAEIDKCDALLMPTRFDEAFGRAAVEAIRRKKFVIASKVDGVPEAVADARLLVDPLDLEAWHGRVSDLVRNPTAFVPAMRNALETARSFDLPQQTSRLERALLEILNSETGATADVLVR